MYGQEHIQNGEVNGLNIEEILKLISTYTFPTVLSIYLIIKIDYFINQLVKNQKDFSQNITLEIKEIKTAINDLKIEILKNR